MGITWIVLNYSLPTEPSRYRVAVWRALKKIGAVNIQQSMWILPDHADNKVTLRKIAREIETNKGEALLMDSVFSDVRHEERIIALFNQIRDDEYQELIRECEKYLLEIAKEISHEKYTFAELEEEEAELEKLTVWHEKITARDLFHASHAEEAAGKCREIAKVFDDYSQRVYAHEIVI